MFRRLDLPKLEPHRSLESSVLLKPPSQLWVTTRHVHRRLDLRVFGVACAWTEKQQNLFGFFPGHNSSPPALLGSRECLSTNTLSCAKPRAMRDLTVPKGTSRIVAISL